MEEHSEFVLFRDIGYRLIICLSELITRCKRYIKGKHISRHTSLIFKREFINSVMN